MVIIWKIKQQENTYVSNFNYPIITTEDKIEKLIEALSENQIETRPLICGSINQQPFWYERYGVSDDVPNADYLHKYGLYLPNNHELKKEEITFICEIVNKTLVTGSNGLVGSQFVNNVIPVTSNICDLRNQNDVNNFFSYYTNKEILGDDVADKVIHCAAKVGGVNYNMTHKGEFFYDNIMINTNVIEAARIHGIKKLVSFLSTCIFPDKIEYPLTEDKIHLGPPHPSNDAYSYSKRMAAVQIKAYKEQYGLEYKSVIPTNIYGINDNFNLDFGHVIPSLIHRCYLARENKTDLVVWGSGKTLREFIYNKDIAKLTEWVLNEYNESEPIILGNSIEISIRDVVELIVKEMNFKGNVIFDTTKPEGQFRKPSDNSKITSYLPNFKFTPIEDGLKETIDWFEKNYNKLRK